MDVATASMIQNVIAGALFLLWLAAAGFVWATFRLSSPNGSPEQDQIPLETEWEAGRCDELRHYQAEVEGNADDLALKAARLLAQGNLAGPVRIDVASTQRVLFSGLEHQPLRRGLMEFDRLGGMRTRIRAVFIRRRGGRGLLWTAMIFCLIGLGALAGTYALIDRFVVQNANPAVRYQVFQMFQAVHLLWEPFLVAGIYRGQRTAQEAAFAAMVNVLVHNLAYWSDSATDR